ncbi:MAG: hypothetical protein DCC57_08170 [Chloroflexi bacterium]|nr:MAG: hypothetical protein DCC57_08170 [Chloroflexota bacterium]
MSKLEFSGAEAQTDRGKPGLTLDQVYTALLTTELVRPEEPAHPGGRRRPSPKPPAPGEERNRSAVEQLNRHARLVLLGDPGSGKSSFVNYITLCLAGELLSDRPANLALLTAPLPQSEEQDAEPPGPQPWDHGPLLPVRIVLRNFAATGLPPVGKPATAKHLWRFICGELATATLGEFAKPLKKHLRDRGGLILLDGLDEVPEADARRTQIKQAVDSFARAFGKCRFLVTSRTYAYQNEAWALEDFASTELACFNAAQIAAFVDRWYARIAPLRDLSAADAQGRAALLKQAIFTNDRLAALAEQPLLLTLMANLHAYRGGSLPEKREQLYAAAVDLLLDWWERQRVVYGKEGQPQVIQPSLVEYLKLGKDRILAVLAELAFEAHASNPDPSQRAYIRQADLIDRLLAVSPDKDLRYERLVEYLSQRAGLLLPQGNRVFTLPHRTFQEYLAACHLTGPTYPDEVAELARQDPNRWREVLLLAGARAAAGTESPLWELAEALCFREPSSAGYGEEDDWGAHLAGQVLLESAGLTQVRPRNQPKLERIRHALVHVLEESCLGRELSACLRTSGGRPHAGPSGRPAARGIRDRGDALLSCARRPLLSG